MNDLSAVVLAAGKGTRMVSEQAKVLHRVCGSPMLKLVYSAVSGLEPDEILVVIGHEAERVRDCLEGHPATFVLQAEQLGTGHALMSACERLSRSRGDVLVLYGDAPRIRTETLSRLVRRHRETGAAMTLITVTTPHSFGYGRILRSRQGEIEAIVEERDANEEQRRIQEINPGFYCFQLPSLVESIAKLTNDNAQREYYITDLVQIQRRAGWRVEALRHDDFDELKGINSRQDLAEMSAMVRRVKNRDLMAAGVTLIDPETTYVDLDVRVENDVTLHPLVTLEGTTRIGAGSVVRTGTRITDSNVGREVHVMESCVITDSEIGGGCVVGPCARIKENTVVGMRCRIGNFVEIKNSSIGDDTKAAHLAYIGDSSIGRNVNVGAGVITCNYDGLKKSATVIEDDAFIGTDSQLVAPVRIGRGAYVAAGSCVTEDVPAESLAIARSRQHNKKDWARRRRAARDKA